MIDITQAWEDVEPQTIAHCFRKTGLFPLSVGAELESSSDPRAISQKHMRTLDELAELIKSISLKTSDYHPLSAEQYIDVDKAEATENELADESIINEVQYFVSIFCMFDYALPYANISLLIKATPRGGTSPSARGRTRRR